MHFTSILIPFSIFFVRVPMFVFKMTSVHILFSCGIIIQCSSFYHGFYVHSRICVVMMNVLLLNHSFFFFRVNDYCTFKFTFTV